MQPSPIQKFIVVFLAIAVTTSSLLFVFAGRVNSGKTTAAGTRTPGAAGPFVENLPGGSHDPEIAALEADYGENVTAKVAEILAEKIVENNPSGPLEQNGELTVAVPAQIDTVMADYLENNTVSADPLYPRVNITDLKVIRSPSNADNVKYAARIAEVLNELSPTEEDLSNPDPEDWIIQSRAKLEKGYLELKKMQVPAPFLIYHKTLLESFYPVMQFSVMANEDPLKAVALEKAAREIAKEQVALFKKEAKKINASALILPEAKLTWLEKFGVVNRAHALIGVPIADSPSSINWLDILTNALLGYVKDKLLKQLASQVVNWVAGKGKPQFVTNWNTFLDNAVNEAAGVVIEQIAPQLCGSPQDIGGVVGIGKVSDFIRKVTTPIDVTSYSATYPTCTLNKAISNIEDFQRDLRNGGWLGYTSMFEPQNTLFGSMISVLERQMQAAAKAKEEALTKALSGGGYVGQEMCDDGNAPTEGGKCADGSKPRVTTPGRNTADLTSKSFDYAYDRIVNANDWKSMAQLLTNIAIDRLIKAGVKGILGYVNSSSSGGTTPPVTPGATVKEQANQVLGFKTKSLDDARYVSKTVGDTVNLLVIVSSQCTSNQGVMTLAKESIPPLAALNDTMSLKIEELRPQVEALKKFVAEIDSKGYTLTDLQSRFGTVAAAQTESNQIAAKISPAEDAYLGANDLYSSCGLDSALNPGGGEDDTSTSTDDGVDDGEGDGEGGP